MKKVIITIALIAILCVTMFAFAGCKSGTSDGKLIIATNAAFAPFEYKEGDTFKGIDIDIMAGFAKSQGLELVVEDMDFDAVVESVGNNGIDIAAAGLTVSEKRAKVVTFSDTYYNASQKLVVLKSDTTFDSCTTAAEVQAILAAKTSAYKVGFQNGTTGEGYVGEYDNVTGQGFNNAGLAVLAMKNGNLNLVVIDDAPANALAAANTEVKVIDIALSEEEYAFGVDPKDTKLLKALNEYIAEIKDNGTYAEILKKYFG